MIKKLFPFVVAVTVSACLPTKKYIIDVRTQDTPQAEAPQRQQSASVPAKQIPKEPMRTQTSQPSYHGLTPLYPNPQVPADKALSICTDQANYAKRSASASYKPSMIRRHSDCELTRFGRYDCDTPSMSGGPWAGVLFGMEAAQDGRMAYDATMSACLAQFGWAD